MSNIEIIQDFIYEMRTFGLTKDTLEVANVLENILTEREQDKKRIKKLEEENETFKNFTSAIFNDNIEKEFVPVQKVNDEIEKYEYMLAETIHGEIQKYTPGEILLKINTLEELLEENK